MEFTQLQDFDFPQFDEWLDLEYPEFVYVPSHLAGPTSPGAELGFVMDYNPVFIMGRYWIIQKPEVSVLQFRGKRPVIRTYLNSEATPYGRIWVPSEPIVVPSYRIQMGNKLRELMEKGET